MIDTKTQIIGIAKELFAEHGFEGVSVRMICSMANCNVSAISYYFGSKEELFHQTLVEDAEKRIKAIQTILTPATSRDDLKAKLKIFLIQFFESSIENSATIKIIARDMRIIAGSDQVKSYFEKLPEIVAQFFKDAQKAGIVHPYLNTRYLHDVMVSPYFLQVLFSTTDSRNDLSTEELRRSFVDQHIELLCKGILV